MTLFLNKGLHDLFVSVRPDSGAAWAIVNQIYEEIEHPAVELDDLSTAVEKLRKCQQRVRLLRLSFLPQMPYPKDRPE